MTLPRCTPCAPTVSWDRLKPQRKPVLIRKWMDGKLFSSKKTVYLYSLKRIKSATRNNMWELSPRSFACA